MYITTVTKVTYELPREEDLYLRFKDLHGDEGWEEHRSGNFVTFSNENSTIREVSILNGAVTFLETN